MSHLDLYVTAFGRPDLLREQHRLLVANLHDPFTLHVLDNTPDPRLASALQLVCFERRIDYITVESEKHEHHEALALAAEMARGAEFWGVLDHDIFPIAPTTLIDRIRPAGFYGVGQTYTPRCGEARRYIWPGFAFFEREWLNGRVPDFAGIKGKFAWDDGDTGSMLHALFTDADWGRFPAGTHEYGTIREPDGEGLQSYGFERFDGGAWLHLVNASRWKAVPDPDGREQLFREMLAAL